GLTSGAMALKKYRMKYAPNASQIRRLIAGTAGPVTAPLRHHDSRTPAPSAMNTAGYASPAQHSAKTARLSAAAPVTKRAGQSFTTRPNSDVPTPAATATVKPAPKRIERA